MVWAERIWETTVDAGVGTLSLLGAQADYEALGDRFSSGALVMYLIDQAGSGWEAGLGTYLGGAPQTLRRDYVFASSNGDAAVNWGGGVKNIFAGMPSLALRALLSDAQAQASSVTLAQADHGKLIDADSSAGDVTVTLPPLAEVPPGFRGLLRVDDATGLATLAATGGELIDGAGSVELRNVGHLVEVIRGTGAWRLLRDRRRRVTTGSADLTSLGASFLDFGNVTPDVRRITVSLVGLDNAEVAGSDHATIKARNGGSNINGAGIFEGSTGEVSDHNEINWEPSRAFYLTPGGGFHNSNTYTGLAVLERMGGNVWRAVVRGFESGVTPSYGAGRLSLPVAMDELRLQHTANMTAGLLTWTMEHGP